MSISAQQIIEKAEAEAKETLERARKIADRERSLARERAEELLEKAKEEGQKVIEEAKQEATARAQMNARNELRAEQYNTVNQILEQALQRLASTLRDEAYLNTLIHLAAEGAKTLGSGKFVVECNQQDMDFLRDSGRLARLEQAVRESTGLDVSFELAPAPIVCAGGLRIRTPDGRVNWVGTFDDILERRRDEFLQRIHEAIFTQDKKTEK